MLRRWLALVAMVVPGLAACSSCRTGSSAGASADAGAVTSAGARTSASAGDDDDDEVRPVYPTDTPPDPLAQKLCEGLHEIQARQRASCCGGSVGVVFTRECVRNLSGALSFKAVTLKPEEVDACVAAMKRTFDGCEWVGPVAPQVPAECVGIVRGTLGAGARCRSTLECSGALRCYGVGPTQRGRCGAAREEGSVCGAATDPLVGFVRDVEADERHPECKGFCYRHKCAPYFSEGQECTLTLQCGPGHRCLGGKCQSAAPAKLGEACPDDACGKGLTCLSKQCAERKAAGASCATDFECIGGCIKPADAGAAIKGTCGKKCG